MALLLFLIDVYVYVNWRHFVHQRPGLLRTLPVYRLFLWLVPLAIPFYFYYFRWWEVEPKMIRALFFGGMILYYLPKALLALGLLIKDAAKGIMWLFEWFQHALEQPADEKDDKKPPLDLVDMKHMSRRMFLQRMGWTVSSVPFVLTGYGVFRTLYDFQVREIELFPAHLPRSLDGLKIVQLSDLHAGSFFSARPMEEAVAIVNDLHPALITITGDYVNHDDAELTQIVPALNNLQAELGIYGCLGNHDHYADTQRLVDRLALTPVDLLVNRHQSLHLDGARIHVIGTDNTGFSQHYADLPAALHGLEDAPPEDFLLLLAHDPTFWDHQVVSTAPQIDLMLCGHTHGGQIGLELGRYGWSFAKVAYRRWAGLYQENRVEGGGQQFLYVNRGLGTVGPPIRFGIRPEITEITLRSS